MSDQEETSCMPLLQRQPANVKHSWYAVYTRANHEKSVACQLRLRSLESFLPLYERTSHWQDRRVKIQVPLFSGYVFVRMALEEKLRVLQTPGVVCLVGFSGVPVALSDTEMEALRRSLIGMLRAEPCPYLRVGRRVRLTSGPLQGLEGVLVKKKGGWRFVVSIDLIQRSIAVEVDAMNVAAA